MRPAKHIMPIVALLFFLLIARQIYPYTTPFNSRVIEEGFVIEQVASGLEDRPAWNGLMKLI